MKNSIQAKSQMDTLFYFYFLVKNRIMKIVKKNQCLLGKHTDYFFASIIKKKKDILDGGGERKEIPKLSKFSKFLTRIQSKNQSN